MKIRNFLDAKTKRELHVHVDSEEGRVITGDLCNGDKSYPVVLIEVEPGIYTRAR